MLVHGSMCGLNPGRVDHWISLAEHLRRYASPSPSPGPRAASHSARVKVTNGTGGRRDAEGREGRAGEAREILGDSAFERGWKCALRVWATVLERTLWGSLSVADAIDIFAHVRTAVAVLSPTEAVVAVAAVEAARRCLQLDLVRHHQPGW